MLHRCAVVNLLLSNVSNALSAVCQKITFTRLDAVLPSRRDHLAAVKLKRRHAVVVLDRLKDPSRAKVPNLFSAYFNAVLHGRKPTYPYRFVQASADDVNFVKLETSHGTGVAQKRSMGLTRAHVPHPHRAVPAAAHERVLPRLHGSDKVLVELPASVRVRGRWHRERARDGKSSQVSRGNRGRRMRYRPEDVHRHHALSRRKVPLT
jgi:hypothetical protein